MPTAIIDEDGTSIYYEDSGIPDGKPEYTTFVLVHGMCINCGIFRKTLSFGPKYGLRLITMNIREYHGSTPYTDAEVAKFRSADLEKQTAGVRTYTQDIAKFLLYVCTTLDIPLAKGENGERSGGLIFLAWSMSGMALLSLFGDPATLDDHQNSVLGHYMRRAVLFDPPSIVYGVLPDIPGISPIHEPNVPVEEIPRIFIRWCSAYSQPVPDGVPITEKFIHSRVELPERTPTLLTLPPETFDDVVETATVLRSNAILFAAGDIHEKNARGTFLDAGEVLPGVDIVALWCDQTPDLCVWSVKVLQGLMEQEPEPGKKKRRASLIKVKGGNHFYHWDEPERMVSLLSDLA